MPEVRSAVPDVVTSAVTLFAKALERRFGPAVLDVRLFGSFARGGADEESDVDVSVVLDHVDWDIKREVIDLATDVGLEFDLLLSPVVFDRSRYLSWREQKRPLVMSIERDGVRL